MNENNMLSNIPQTLKELSRWILWRLERRDGSETKVPYRIDGAKASCTNPNDWTDFATAVSAFDPEKYNGLGFVLKREDNIVCIDLDNCIGDDGKICDEAIPIVRIMNSWTEVSQSGKGLHIFVRGTKPTDKSKATPRGFKSLEIYDHARYIAMTGNHLPGTPLEIIERQNHLIKLCDFYFPKSESTPTQAIKPQRDSLTDEEIISLCRKAKNADKFCALYDNGDTRAYNNDESRADEALACLLAFYTQDEAQIERIMNKSALARREKWRERQDYRERTIRKAISLSREHYSPKPKSTMNLDSHSPTRLKVKLDVECPRCESFTLDIFKQDGMYFLKCLLAISANP
jgi:putative DNA primase/helicase